MSHYNKVTPAIITVLQDLVGNRNVIIDVDRMIPYAHDEISDPSVNHLPEVVVLAETTEQVAKVVKLANEERIPVVPRGAGTGLACAVIPIYGGIVLSLEKMNKVIEINTENMYMIVEPGVRTDELQKLAIAQDLFYAGDPSSGDSCFIGGNLATNAGGNRAIKYGTTRHQVYGFEMVTPKGDITNVGGRIRKNTTGYALDQLIMGSEGTLGIITRITLKLIPRPKYVIDLLAIFPTIDSAIAIVSKILNTGITPTCVEFMDNVTIKTVEHFLKEKLPQSDTGNYIIIQVEGTNEDDLDDKSIFLDELCATNGATSVLIADPQKIWRARKAFADACRHESAIMGKEDIVVPVDQIPALMRTIGRLSEKYGLLARTGGHAGDGNIHLNILKCDIPDDEWAVKIEAFEHDLYDMVYKIGGKLSGEHGIGYKRKKLLAEYADPVELAMMRDIKRSLDPNNILNPGKIFDI
jgi:glycolate oxidase